MDDNRDDNGESAQQGSRWALKSSDGANYPLFFGSNFVGRSSNTQNYLNIKCANVSIAYLHADIEVSDDEYHCFVKDFRTLTGTFIDKASVVDGERVLLRQKVEYIRTAIEPGTIIYFGSDAFEVIRGGGGDASTEDTPQQFQSVRADEETQLLDERLLQRANLSGIIGMRGAGAHVATAVLAGSIPSAFGAGMTSGTGIGTAGNRPIGILEQDTQAIGIPEIEEEEEDEEENVAVAHNNKKEEEAMEEEGGDLFENGNPVEVRGSSSTRASCVEREQNSGLNVSERQESDDDSTDCDEEDVAKSAGNTSAVIALTSASAALEQQQQQHGVIYGGYAGGSGTAAEDDETGIEYNINHSNIFNAPSAAQGFAPAVAAHAADLGGDGTEAEEEEEEGTKEVEASGADSPASTNLLLGAAAGIDISAINEAERHSVEGGEGILSSSESPAGGDIEPVPGEEELPDPSTAIAAAAVETTTTRAATMGKTETKNVIMAEVSISSSGSGSSESGDRSSSCSSSNNGHETASSALGAAVGRLADAVVEVEVGSEAGTGLNSEATGSTGSTGVLAGKLPAIGVVGSDLQARSSARSRRLPANPAMHTVNEGARATHTLSRPSAPPSSALVSSIATRGEGGAGSMGVEGSQSALSPSTAYAILSTEAVPALVPHDKALSIEQEAATKIAADIRGSRRGKRALSDRISNGNDGDADGDIGGDLKTKQRKASRRKTTTTTPAQGRNKEAAGNSVEDVEEEGEDVDTVSYLKRSGSLASAAQQARTENGGGKGGALLLLQEEGESAPRSKVSNCGMGERSTPNVSKPAARGGAVNVSSTKALAMNRGGVRGGKKGKVSPPTPLPPSSTAELAITTVIITAPDAPTTALDDVSGGNAASELPEGKGLTKFREGMSTNENTDDAPAAAVVSGDVVLAASTLVLASSSNNNTADDQRIIDSKVAPDKAAARTELTKRRGKRNSSAVAVVATDTDTAIPADAASPSLLEDQQPPAKIAKRSGARKSTAAGRKRGVSSIDETADDDVAPASRARGVKGGKKLTVSLSLSSPSPISPVVPSTAATIAATTAAAAVPPTSKGTTASASTPVGSASANMTEAQWVEEAHSEVEGAEGVVASSKKPAKAPKHLRSPSIIRGPLCEEDEGGAVANMEGAQAGSATAVVAVAAAEKAEEVPLLLEERDEAAVGKENAANDEEKKDKRKTPVSRGKRAPVSVKGSYTTSTVDTITAAAEATTMNANSAVVGQPIESATVESKGAAVGEGKVEAEDVEARKEVEDEKKQDNDEIVDRVFFTGFDKESSAYLSALSIIETLPGLSVVDTPSEATHLVTYPDKTVKRTANLLIALNSGVRYVLDSRWVKRSAKLKRPAPIADLKSEFIVRDRAKEKEWGFDLAQSLSVSAERARVRHDSKGMIGSSSGGSSVDGNGAEGGKGVFTGVLFYITEGMGSASAVADMRSIIESGGGILCDSLPFLPPAAFASATHSNISSGSKAPEEQTYDAIVISTAAALKDLNPKTKSILLQALSHDIGSILRTSCIDSNSSSSSSSSKGSAIKRGSSASKRRASSAPAPSPVPATTSVAVLDGKEGREDSGSGVTGREARQVETGRVKVRGVFTRDAILLAVLRQAPIDFSENRLSMP